MNKLVTVFGVAAVATLAGCKDPNYQPYASSQNEVKVAEPVPAPAVEIVPATPTCKCPPGTKHTSPCACGAPDCLCIVEVKPVVQPPAPEAAYTTYIVQNGDYLAKISKKFNVTIGSIKKLNGMTSDTIRVGQKLKLPGKIDVGVQTVPVKAEAAKKAVVRGAAEYKGATKEYVVKSGDTLGAIAYGNGCNIRQLKKLNGLSSDSLKVGQKLKVPAEVKAAASVAKSVKAEVPAPKAAEAPKPVVAPVAAPVAAPVVAPPTPVETPVEAAPVAPVEEAASAPAAEQGSTYTVQEGDDMTGVTIRFGVTAAAIRELNGLSEDAQLTPGQTIKLPADAQQ